MVLFFIGSTVVCIGQQGLVSKMALYLGHQIIYMLRDDNWVMIPRPDFYNASKPTSGKNICWAEDGYFPVINQAKITKERRQRSPRGANRAQSSNIRFLAPVHGFSVLLFSSSDLRCNYETRHRILLSVKHCVGMPKNLTRSSKQCGIYKSPN